MKGKGARVDEQGKGHLKRIKRERKKEMTGTRRREDGASMTGRGRGLMVEGDRGF